MESDFRLFKVEGAAGQILTVTRHVNILTLTGAKADEMLNQSSSFPALLPKLRRLLHYSLATLKGGDPVSDLQGNTGWQTGSTRSFRSLAR
jgi:hypothetical protein